MITYRSIIDMASRQHLPNHELEVMLKQVVNLDTDRAYNEGWQACLDNTIAFLTGEREP